MDTPGVRHINPGFRKPKFSRIEIRDISIAILVLSVSFTLIYRNNNGFFSDDYVTNILCWFGVSFIFVITSFMMHEMGHKFTAQRFGAWSEFRMYPFGLMICLISSFFGFLFAMPGAVYTTGYITEEQNGKISVAGPAVNIVLCAISLILAMIFGGMYSKVGAILLVLAYLNSFLAVFNMLPIGPLDGGKILRWNGMVYGMMIALSIAFLIITRIVINA